MKKIISLVIMMSVFMACKNIQDSTGEVIHIPVNVNDVTKDAASFLEKIEIVPLETNDSILLNVPSGVFYDKRSDMYVVMADMNVFTFTGKGKSIGSSVKKRGQGPDEYTMIMDMKYNHFLNGIDLLGPYGTIYTYSPTFELLARRTFKPEFPVSYILPLDSCNYLFKFTNLWVDQEIGFVNLKTGDTNIAVFDGMISGGNGLRHQHFHKIGDEFYFIPQGVNYNIYRIDTLKKELSPAIYLDFGKAEIKKEDLPGRASGKRVDNDRDRLNVAKEYAERHKFLSGSDKYTIPMQKLFNEDFVYILMARGEEMKHYIYNRSKEKGFLIKDDTPLSMHPCFGIDDNILFAICQPVALPSVVDRRFMTQKQVAIMEHLKEDDNPVIIKYYLKR